ncbi:membrane protein [Adhaeribacter aerolatus]|uniref:Membrane protein n=1 Tax=Adhaeribacter aerolatus TaxID=670289 RepID=A0A512ATX3_9BACT|nr:heparan-alpha-glucosaminide N-acetyltransferase domain-containing protein [Adhaeribacter aerolatus]GEO03166.1 membrane protein [Adhaeribacter aerolatus]
MITASLKKSTLAAPVTGLENATRISSIDFLRGLVMVIMVLDHVRAFFHVDAHIQDPMNMDTTTPALFFTRWITHFCAPTFVFISGISAYKAGEKSRSTKELSLFLLSRGLWLMFLEITIITFGLTFDIYYRMFVLQVIWAIGVSMVVLAGLVFLPRAAILTFGVLLVIGHNLLDSVQVTTAPLNYLWSALHVPGMLHPDPDFMVFLVYPVLPWIGLMALGFYAGKLYQFGFDARLRRRILIMAGLGCMALFLLLRFTQAYGDNQEFESQSAIWKSVYDFLNTTKYPPSFHFLLMTLGPALLLLALSENFRFKVAVVLVTIGRVPLFFYVLHIYLIHALAYFTALASGYTWHDIQTSQNFGSLPAGFGYSLGSVYVFWALVLLLLYPLCKWFAKYKARHRNNPFLSYL